MTTTIARHQRSASGGQEYVCALPVLAAPTSSTATVVLDGRLLEVQAQEGQQRVKLPDGAKTRTVARPAPLGRAPETRVPLSPPRAHGKSLAPLPLMEHYVEKAAPAAVLTKPQVRPPPTHTVLPAAAPPNGGGVAASHSATASQQLLIAEGRGIPRGKAPDPRIATYLEIYGTRGDDDADSHRSTPPPISLNTLTRSETQGPLGPLSPCPLSPSILTICEQPGLDDQFQFAAPREELVDMRVCQSPKLPPV